MTSLDLRSNSKTIEIGGKTYRLDFDMLAMSHAEAVYARQFGIAANVQVIMGDMFGQKSTAVMALAYGALTSAGNKIAWDTFAKGLYTWTTLEKWNEIVVRGVADMMPEPAEDDSNGEAAPEKK